MAGRTRVNRTLDQFTATEVLLASAYGFELTTENDVGNNKFQVLRRQGLRIQKYAIRKNDPNDDFAYWGCYEQSPSQSWARNGYEQFSTLDKLLERDRRVR